MDAPLGKYVLTDERSRDLFSPTYFVLGTKHPEFHMLPLYLPLPGHFDTRVVCK